MTIVYVGVDVAKAKLDVAVAVSAGHPGQARRAVGKFENNGVGIERLVQQVTEASQTQGEVTFQLVVEPTGGYEARLVAFAYAQGWQVTLVNPLQVRRWAEGMGVRAKTDRVDAGVLSWYGAATQPAGQEPMGEAAQQLDELLRRRTELEQLRQAERNRQAAAGHKPHTRRQSTRALCARYRRWTRNWLPSRRPSSNCSSRSWSCTNNSSCSARCPGWVNESRCRCWRCCIALRRVQRVKVRPNNWSPLSVWTPNPTRVGVASTNGRSFRIRAMPRCVRYSIWVPWAGSGVVA